MQEKGNLASLTIVNALPVGYFYLFHTTLNYI